VPQIVRTAAFIKSSTNNEQCPPDDKPEFAFIGRSNVGKSSLINYITGFLKLAKTSGSPGKTQTINHFLIDSSWYLVDLPGYGYAKVSKELRANWQQMLHGYLRNRENLLYTFVLVDSRLEPQKSDVDFINWLGIEQIPFAIVFTKTDKNTNSKTQTNLNVYRKKLLEYWDELPPIFLSSAESGVGKEEILTFISENMHHFEAKRGA